MYLKDLYNKEIDSLSKIIEKNLKKTENGSSGGFIPLETINLSLKNNYRSDLKFLFVDNVYLIPHNINPK